MAIFYFVKFFAHFIFGGCQVSVHQLTRGRVGISEAVGLDELHAASMWGDMDVQAHALGVDHCAAEATGLAARELRGQLACRIPHRVFPRCPGAALPIFVEVGLRAIGEKDQLRQLEVAARLIEAGRGAGRAVAGL
jgi:hypothetical protein